jgi:alpha-L-rhamnosidase
LDRDAADLWDSGRVTSGQSAGVRYAGKPLRSRQRACWKVCVWNEAGESTGFSAPANFEMALLDVPDWQASWIGSPGGTLGGARYFRCAFAIAAPAVKARLYATGLGYHQIFINGRRQGDAVLDPAYTDISKRIFYTTHDARPALVAGENVISAIVGSGWHGVPMLLAQLEIDFADGTRQVVATNRMKDAPPWMVATGPIVSASVFDGETYDARLEKAGWNLPEYDERSVTERSALWTQVFSLRAPGGRLQAQPLEPIRVIREMPPLSVQESKPGIFVFDFGQNHAGWARLRVEGASGTTITLKYAEILLPDGTVNQENLRTAKATDTYILRGGGAESWSPSFTYHGYRYVQVEGWPGQPARSSLTACIVRSAVASRGEFSCSDLLLNRVHEMVRWTEESNLHGIPTDCPQRNERMGWLNDLAARAEELVHNFEVTRLLEKFVTDIGDAQELHSGALSDTVPFHWGRQPADPVSACYLQIPWLLYLHSGDRQVLEQNYEGMRRWVDFLTSKAEEGMVAYSHYGDWAPPADEAVAGSVGSGAISAKTPGALISTAFYFYAASLFGKISGVLGRSGDGEKYQALGARIKAAFHRSFWREAESGYGSGNQACNAIALYLKLVPAEFRERVISALVRDVAKHDYHLTTGNLCTKYLLEVLSKEGHAETAVAIATQTTYPSWGYMLANGATTLWERWELRTGGGMNSHNHPMLGSVGSWLYRWVAGLAVAETREDRAQFVIQPPLVGGMMHAQASLRTIWGRASVAWKREGLRFRLEVQVPWNCSALVHLPKDAGSHAIGAGRYVFVTELLTEPQPILKK